MMPALELADLGYDAIPLRPNSKRPLCDDWQHKAPAVQWQDAPAGCNVGLRAGGVLPFAVIDADDKNQPGTAETVKRILAGMGYYTDHYPLVRTASGAGRHVYVRLAQPIADGHNYHTLKRDVGAGEFRYGPGAQVVGVGSIVDGREYVLEAGDLRQLPVLDQGDAALFVDFAAARPTAPAPSKPPRLARGAYAILQGEAAALAKYPSRSEADAALLADLIRKGATWDTVLSLYLTNPTTGKFRELRDTKGEGAAVGWLRRSYDAIRERSRTWESEGRRLALAVQRWELAQPTPQGSQAKTTRDVLLACADIAAQAGAKEFAAPVRRVAEGAGVHYQTVMGHMQRLLAAGRLELAKAAVGCCGATYRLAGVPVTDLPTGDNAAADDKMMHRSTTSTHPACVEVVERCIKINADVWRTRGLGKTGHAIYGALLAQPGLTTSEVAKAAGCNRVTALRLLRKMSGAWVDPKTKAACRLIDPLTGESLRLVALQGKRWHALTNIDWQAVARALGTDGAGERQKQRHERERASRQRAFLRAREGTTPRPAVTATDRKRLRRSHKLIDALRSPAPEGAAPEDYALAQGAAGRVM